MYYGLTDYELRENLTSSSLEYKLIQKGPVKNSYKYSTIHHNTWSLDKDIAKRLAAFERNVLRRMFGGWGGGIRKMQIRGSTVIINAAVRRFRYTSICQNEPVELDCPS